MCGKASEIFCKHELFLELVFFILNTFKSEHLCF